MITGISGLDYAVREWIDIIMFGAMVVGMWVCGFALWRIGTAIAEIRKY